MDEEGTVADVFDFVFVMFFVFFVIRGFNVVL